jgi:hypothetical protein
MAKTIAVNRKSRGRPRVDAKLVGVRIPPDMLAALDKYGGENRPAAVRMILRQWLREKGFLA